MCTPFSHEIVQAGAVKVFKLHQQTPPPEELDDVPAEGGHGLLIPDDGQEGLRADDPAPNG